jgi:Arc/MetJ family transcription regulator
MGDIPRVCKRSRFIAAEGAEERDSITYLCYLGNHRGGADMARTNIDLDDRLVEEGLRVFKCKTKKELIHLALQELLKTEKRREILKLRGRLQWEGDLEETRRSRV